MNDSQTAPKVHGTRSNISNMSYVLKSDLEAAIDTAVLTIQTSMIENLRPINEALSRLESNVSINSTTLAQQGEEISFLKSENLKLHQTIDNLASRIDNLENAPACDHSQSPEANATLKFGPMTNWACRFQGFREFELHWDLCLHKHRNS